MQTREPAREDLEATLWKVNTTLNGGLACTPSPAASLTQPGYRPFCKAESMSPTGIAGDMRRAKAKDGLCGPRLCRLRDRRPIKLYEAGIRRGQIRAASDPAPRATDRCSSW